MVKRGESYYLTPAEVALFFYRLSEKHMANLNEELRQAVQDFRRRVQGIIEVHKALTGAAPDLQAAVAQVADLDGATEMLRRGDHEGMLQKLLRGRMT